MATEIKNKPSSRTAITITLNGLASSTARAGYQSDIISNTTAQYASIEVAVKVTSSGTPTSDTGVYVHLIRSNGTERSDSAGASTAAITQKSADLIGFIPVGASPSAGQVLEGIFTFHNPGREWGIIVWHDTGVALHASAGNAAAYVGLLPEIQA